MTILHDMVYPCFIWDPPIPPNKRWWLSKPIKLVDDILQWVCHDEFRQKKCRELKLLLTVNQQQYEAALAKRSSTSRPISLSCQWTKAIRISLSSYRVIFTKGF